MSSMLFGGGNALPRSGLQTDESACIAAAPAPIPLTLCSAAPTIARAMSQALPENVDAWRMVQARRRFEGKLPLAALPRLAADLAACDGDVVFDLEFDRDELGVSFLRVRADAVLPLICQRTLDRFEFS